MTRTDIIQYLIDKIDAKNYLEIGMGPGLNFKTIRCDNKISVDPNPTIEVVFKMTSNEFFEINETKFDIVFIDGLHQKEQVYEDILNALKVIPSNGYVICHDMNPENEIIQRYPQHEPNTPWTGDCWKAWVKLRSERSNLNMFVIDTDFGCGVICHGFQNLIKIPEILTYEYLQKNRKHILNLIQKEDFYNAV